MRCVLVGMPEVACSAVHVLAEVENVQIFALTPADAASVADGVRGHSVQLAKALGHDGLFSVWFRVVVPLDKLCARKGALVTCALDVHVLAREREV